LGPRPIDLHLNALREMGFTVTEEGGKISCGGKGKGKKIYLSFPSVGATENILLTALSVPGETYIINAAREPEICDLVGFLRAAGAHISGEGSPVIAVEGGRPLHPVDYRVMSDRIAAVTYASAVACAGGRVTLKGFYPDDAQPVLSQLAGAGCELTYEKDRLTLAGSGRLHPFYAIKTAPYPGFPTDAQAILMATALKGKGVSAFTETIFESRFRHAEEMRRMGADIRLYGHSALVFGVERLCGADVSATDLRGGAALMLAALGAEGESVIRGMNYVHRGYEHLEENLIALGANIRFL